MWLFPGHHCFRNALVFASLALSATATTAGSEGSVHRNATEWLIHNRNNKDPSFGRHPVQNRQNHEGGSTNKEDPPSWEDLDGRDVPSWYGEAKFGIFLHWGVFSVPALCSEWFGSYWKESWGPCASQIALYMNKTERPQFTYQEFAPRFQAELYNATEWSAIFAKAGAQYVVLTSKHHEGYCMWNSTNVASTWQWNVMDVGPRRDLLGELAHAVKKTKSSQTGRRVKFGVYHSLYEWFNPLYQQDRARNFTSNQFVQQKTLAELHDLVIQYQPELIWSDGEWEAHSDYWQAREFLHWYATQVPTGVWNDRWGSDTLCKHGDFLTCADRYSPGHLVNKKWENALTIDKSSWGWNRLATYDNYFTTQELIHSLIETVAYNGNFLLNVGPSADGTINPIFVDRLYGMGKWLTVNGNAIYDTVPWNLCQTDFLRTATTDNERNPTSLVYYTRKQNMLFAHLTEWPPNNEIYLTCPQASKDTVITLLGYSAAAAAAATTSTGAAESSSRGCPIPWSSNKRSTRTTTPTSHDLGGRERRRGVSGLRVVLPPLTPNVIPCQHAWVLQMTNIANIDESAEKPAVRESRS